MVIEKYIWDSQKHTYDFKKLETLNMVTKIKFYSLGKIWTKCLGELVYGFKLDSMPNCQILANWVEN